MKILKKDCMEKHKDMEKAKEIALDTNNALSAYRD